MSLSAIAKVVGLPFPELCGAALFSCYWGTIFSHAAAAASFSSGPSSEKIIRYSTGCVEIDRSREGGGGERGIHLRGRRGGMGTCMEGRFLVRMREDTKRKG